MHKYRAVYYHIHSGRGGVNCVLGILHIKVRVSTTVHFFSINLGDVDGLTSIEVVGSDTFRFGPNSDYRTDIRFPISRIVVNITTVPLLSSSTNFSKNLVINSGERFEIGESLNSSSCEVLNVTVTTYLRLPEEKFSIDAMRTTQRHFTYSRELGLEGILNVF